MRFNLVFMNCMLCLLIGGLGEARAADYTLVYNAVQVHSVDSSKGEVHLGVSANVWDVNASTGTGNWDGHLTSAGRKYAHAHATKVFPIVFTGQGYSDNEISADEVATFWKAILPDSTVAESATTSKNCHGYSTGKGTYIDVDVSEGIGRIVNDDFESGVGLKLYNFMEEKGTGSNKERDHSYFVSDWSSIVECSVTLYTHVKIREKWNSSPVMETAWADLDAAKRILYLTDYDDKKLK